MAISLVAGGFTVATAPVAEASTPDPCVASGTSFADNGTEGSPELIGTAADLAQLSVDSNQASKLSGYYKLTADIDLEDCLWTPIGNHSVSGQWFAGVLDGDGHLISNFSVDGGSNDRQGLIGYIYSPDTVAVKDLGVIDASVESSGEELGLVVGSLRGVADRVYSMGSVRATSGSSALDVGGVAGSVSSGGKLRNSYSRATVYSADSGGEGGVGGLVGYGSGSSTISFSFAAGEVSSGESDNLGGLVGNNSGVTVDNSFYDSETTGQSDTGKGTGKTTAEMTSVSTYNDTDTVGLTTAWDIVEGWEAFDPDSNKIWGISPDANDGYPFLLFQFTGTVTFDANEGTGSMSDQYGRNSEALTAHTLSRSGYTFDGWNTSADGTGTSYADAADFPFDGEDTLYAQWQEVVADSGGSGSSDDSGSEAVPLTAPTASAAQTSALLGKSEEDQQPVSTPRLTGPTGTSEPSGPTVYVDGRQVRAEVQKADSDLRVSFGEWELNLGTNPAFWTGVEQGGSGPALSMSGFRPTAPVQVWFGSDSREVGAGVVGDDGRADLELTGQFAAGSTDLPVGPQKMQVTSYDQDGRLVAVDVVVDVAQGPVQPQVDPRTADFPALAGGVFYGSSAGEVADVASSLFRSEGVVSLEAADWQVSHGFGAGSLSEENSDIARLSVGQEASVAGAGLLPGTNASVWLFPGPVLLGTVVVADDGSFAIDYLVDPRAVAAGSYTLQVQGIGADGLIKSINLGVDVVAPVEGSAWFTPALGWALVGVGVAGFVAFWWFVLGRRRRREDDRAPRAAR